MDIKEWTGLEFTKFQRAVENIKKKKKMEETGCEVICGAPTTPVVKGQVKDGCHIEKVMHSMICETLVFIQVR